MARKSLADYFSEFRKLGQDYAYAQREGYRTRRSTYRQIAEGACRMARELESRGLARGDRVLIWGPNSAEWVVSFFACVLLGIVVVPMDDAASPDFTARVSSEVDAKLWVCSREHAQLRGNREALILEDLPSILTARDSSPLPAAPLAPEDTLEVIFTSGTTAQPKGVVITHGNVLANIAPLEKEIAKYRKYERLVHPVRFLCLLPLSHVFGQFLAIFLPPLLGGTVMFQQALKPAEVIATIRRERISLLVAVPRMLRSLQEKFERDVEDSGQAAKFAAQFHKAQGKSFLRRWWIFRRIHRRFGWKFWAFISGGAALDRETEEFWGRLGYAVVQGYGLTETTSLVSVNHPFHLGKGSIGKVLAGREIKLAEDGEILVRGGGVASGYWDKETMRPAADADGWYRTGDIGEMDAEGYLYFKARKKEVIVTPAGMNVYPADLEAALLRQPEVRDCIVVAVPRDGNAEPCGVMILRDPEADLSAVVGRANQSLAEYQRMHLWYRWPEEDFPRTSTQKPKTSEIRNLVLASLNHATPAGQAARPVDDLVQRITGRTPASPETDLDAGLGLSSLERVDLMSALEDRFQVDLSETRFAAAKTVGDVERLLRGGVQSRAHYDYPRWVQRWPVRWIRLAAHYLLLRPAVFLLGWPRVEGRHNLRGVPGPVLVICNHIGDVDVGFILTAVPAHLRHRLATATGGEALQALHTPPSSESWPLRIFHRVQWVLGVSLLNLFPLPREAGFRESFSYAGELVDRGSSILVFPEGKHTTDGSLLPFRAGIGLLANNLEIPIIPMRIHGLFERKQAGKKFAWPGQIRVRIGQPVCFPPGSDPQSIADQLRAQVAGL